MVSVFPASEKFDSNLKLDAENICPPMNNNITPIPTQNPWAWVGMSMGMGMGMGMGTQCRALMSLYLLYQTLNIFFSVVDGSLQLMLPSATKSRYLQVVGWVK